MKLLEKLLFGLIFLLLFFLIYRVCDGLSGRAFLNELRTAAYYSVDARLFDGG